MNRPERWQVGEPLSARKLNETRRESTLARNSSVTGPGSAIVGDNFGMHAQHHQKPSVLLVEAQEEFSKGGFTDNYQTIDYIYSGWCLLYRFDKTTGDYKKETGYTGAMIRVWDVFGKREKGDIFYAVYNKDSQRLEAIPGSDLKIQEGLCLGCVGNGWYEIELADFPFECGKAEETDCSGSGSSESNDSESSAGDTCDLCNAGSESGSDATEESASDSDCLTVTEFTVEKVRPIPREPQEVVCAHDARTLPIKIGGHVRMLPIGAGCDGQRLYAIVSAEYEMIKVPLPDWECCDGEVVMTACNYMIVEGKYCTGWATGCPSGSDGGGTGGGTGGGGVGDGGDGGGDGGGGGVVLP